jgi:ketosteroid isomerase-like protein
LAAIQDEWCKARVTGDVHFLERLYADNVTIAVSDGRVIGRTEDLAEFAAKKSRPESVVDEGLKIKLYGDTAVVTGLERLQGHAGGNTVEVLLRVLNVFVKMNGEWRLVARQGTTLNSSPGGHS